MRPTQRPEKPYTIQDVVDRVYQHFVVEKNGRGQRPRGSSDETVACYGNTGCAVGCCLTEDDADTLDIATDVGYMVNSIMRDDDSDKARILKRYFGDDMLHTSMLPFLSDMQDAHDSTSKHGGPDRVAEQMYTFLSSRANIYGYVCPPAPQTKEKQA